MSSEFVRRAFKWLECVDVGSVFCAADGTRIWDTRTTDWMIQDDFLLHLLRTRYRASVAFDFRDAMSEMPIGSDRSEFLFQTIRSISDERSRTWHPPRPNPTIRSRACWMDTANVDGGALVVPISRRYHRHHCIVVAGNWGNQNPDTHDDIVAGGL